MSINLSIRAICEKNGLPTNYYGRWKKDLQRAEAAMISSVHRSHVTQDTCSTMHQGRKSILEPYADQIGQTMTYLRDRGVAVTTLRVTMEANKLCTALNSRLRVLKPRNAL